MRGPLFAINSKIQVEVDERFPLFADTFQEAIYLGGTTCKLFGKNFEWAKGQLHSSECRWTDMKFEVGEQVHIFLRNRSGVDEDGNWREIDSVWVKAQIVSILGEDECKVMHLNWNCKNKNAQKVIRSVHRNDMRGARLGLKLILRKI